MHFTRTKGAGVCQFPAGGCRGHLYVALEGEGGRSNEHRPMKAGGTDKQTGVLVTPADRALPPSDRPMR